MTILKDAGGQQSLLLPAEFLGNNGPQSRTYVGQSPGSQHVPLFMYGTAGSAFLLGDLFRAAGYPLGQAGISISGVSLDVNGFASPLTGNQIAGYQINNGDNISLTFTS